MKEILRQYIRENGVDALWNAEELSAFLRRHKVPERRIYQLLLVLRCGNLREYLERSGNNITSVEINTVIVITIRDTSLKPDTVKALLYDVISALGIDCSYERFFLPNERSLPVEAHGSIVQTEAAFISSKDIMNELNTARVYLSNKNYESALRIYEKLAKAGVAEAMFNIGICYREGKGTAQNEEIAMQWFEAAAKNGEPRANAMMGDYYFYHKNPAKRDLRKAYRYYSAPGAIAAQGKVKENIVTILNQEKINRIVLILAGVMLALMWVFAFVCPYSLHNGFFLIGLSIPVTLLSTAAYGLGWFSYIRTKYNNVKLFLILMLAVWAILPLLIVIL